jgi:hypothetical protein
MLERELVHELERCAAKNRDLAVGLQSLLGPKDDRKWLQFLKQFIQEQRICSLCIALLYEAVARGSSVCIEPCRFAWR